MPHVAKIWRLLPHEPAAIARLADALRVSPVAAQLLLNRGITEPADARRFIDSPLSGLHPPERIPGLPDAVERLASVVRERRRVCVFGDYDVDGITGTSILLQLLNILEVPVEFHMPNRLEDGYGLRIEALRELASRGIQTVVTVDCGITAVEEAEEARKLGIELIITDHHEPKFAIPRADAVVHPRLPGGDYPFGGLSGAGVAFKLAWALCTHISGSSKVQPRMREFLLDATVLAALGLIADVVPLHDENRIFVKHGLNRLRTSPPLGVRALVESAGFAAGKALRAEDVAFRLAPRLNAAGRLGCARLVVELLTTTNGPKARDLAAYLDGQNRERQTLERKMVVHAREMLEDPALAALPAIVLAHADWHPGVIGIVAGRLVEQFGKPTMLIAGAGETASGSGRSIPGFALHEALQACTGDLISHGGHAAAAGFRIRRDAIDLFRNHMCDYAAGIFPAGPPPPMLVIDAEVPLSSLTFGLLNEIDRLEPYGAQNPKPKFLAGRLEIVGEPKLMGGGDRHLSLRVRQNGTTMRAVAFGMAERRDELMADGGRCNLVYTPNVNEWNDYRNIEMIVNDFQAGPIARLG